MFKWLKKAKNSQRKDFKEIEWNDLSVRQFMEISNVHNKEEEDDFYDYLAIIHNTTKDDIMSRNYHEVIDMMRELRFLTKEPKKGLRPRKSYNINGTEYEVLLDPNDMTTAQYIDFQMIDSDYENHIADILSIMLIPKGKKYNEGYKIEEAKEEIYNYLGVEDALTLANFFSFWSSVFTRLMLARLTRELKKIRKAEQTPEIREKMQMLEKLLADYRKNEPGL